MLTPNTVYNVYDVEFTVNESAQTITATGKRIVANLPTWPDTYARFTETESMRETLTKAPFCLDDDAAAFVCEWLPEYIYTVADICKFYPYAWQTFAQMDESELENYLHGFDYDSHTVNEDEYNEQYGATYRDAAFNGVLVIGE